jgi:UDP-N-acetylmuramoyl-tripeptide--D-alanyl-D-alanine ligase
MGTNHFGEIGYLSGLASPDLGLITNIGKAHLEYFDTPAKVYKEKISLKKHLKRGCYLILNNDDKFLKKTVFKNKITFGLGQNCDFSASNIKFSQAGYDFLVNGKYKMRLNCLGRQNIYNALAAICVARHYGIDFATISESIRDFKFPKMRLEYFKANGIEVINDAYNSNPDSLKLAIDTLADFTKKSRRILITADMLELGKKSAKFHEEMGSYIAQKGVIDLLISVGKFSKNLSGAAKKEGMSEAAVKSFDLLNGSISAITDSIKPGDVVLVKGSRMMQMERLVEAIKGKA